ncbi:MAG: LTA synthase family protein [Pseudomonadota bacterium]
MIEALWPALLLGLPLTLGVEALLRPAPSPFWRRAPATLAVHLGSWLLLFALGVLLLQRPWFALAVIVSLQLVVVQTSNTKSRTLDEPFICQDFDYFLDAILHPRLYVPFFGIGLAIAASVTGALAIGAFLWLEPSLVTRHGAPALLQAGLLLPPALALLWAGGRRLPACRLEPQQDLNRLGLFAALWAYGVRAVQPLDTARLPTPFRPPADAPAPSPARLPHVVAVQSESFFDPREWLPATPPGLLDAWDRLTREAVASGPLDVPAWGANTVRTECAFLTGLPPQAFGIHRFSPYRQLARRPVPTLASRLRALGYRTLCVHPYPASFYQRDKVMPRMGFDAFLDITAFSEVERDGQYISDATVADKVGTLLDASDNRPLFIFVITMENHGPLPLERPVPPDAPCLAAPRGAASPAADSDDLRVYLRHLRNADRMLERLKRRLTPDTPRSRHGVLCWYGDHVPIMDELYRATGAPSGDTHYALWSSMCPGATPPPAERIDVATLSQRLLARLLADAGRAPNDPVEQTQSHQEQE